MESLNVEEIIMELSFNLHFKTYTGTGLKMLIRQQLKECHCLHTLTGHGKDYKSPSRNFNIKMCPTKLVVPSQMCLKFGASIN